MSSSTQSMAQGLKDAFLAEVEGEHFYRMAAATTADPKGRQVFEQLAAEERQHQQFLRSQYDALLRSGELDETLELGSPGPMDGESPIFSDALRARMADAHFEMTALSVGAQLELAAEQHYRAAAKSANLSFVKRFFEELANWEARHYEALHKQLELLREDYWQASGFHPF